MAQNAGPERSNDEIPMGFGAHHQWSKGRTFRMETRLLSQPFS